MPKNIYRIRQTSKKGRSPGQRQDAYVLTVPPEVASKLPEGMEYEFSIDEDGLHYRPVIEDEDLPSWAI